MNRLISNDDDERLVGFLRLGLTSANTLGKFQKNMNHEKMPLSSAYILNEINKTSSKKSNNSEFKNSSFGCYFFWISKSIILYLKNKTRKGEKNE